MAILATDIMIKTMIEAAFQDLRKNSWLLDDVFGGLAEDPLSQKEYGYKEVSLAKKWFLDNKINVFLGFRTDQPTLPCVSIVQQSSHEKLDRTSFSDEGLYEEIDPTKAQRPINMVIPQFTPTAYDPVTGTVTLPKEHSTDTVAAGMYLVINGGKKFIITSVLSGQSFTIKAGTKVSLTNCFIVPATYLWNLHRELTYMEESFAIGVHSVSEPVENIWMRQLMTYCLLRYKESFLEARGFELSTFQISAMSVNSAFEMDRVFSTYFTLSGVVQADWIKFIAPKLAIVTGNIRLDKVYQNEMKKDLAKIVTPEQYKEIVKSQSWQMIDDHFNDSVDDDSVGLEPVF